MLIRTKKRLKKDRGEKPASKNVRQDLGKAAFIIYLATLVICIVLFGSIYSIGYTVMSAGALMGGLLLVLKNIERNPETQQYEIRFFGGNIYFIFIVFLVFLIFQVIPLPQNILQIISPESWVVGQKSLPASSVALSVPDSISLAGEWFSISPYDYPVRMSIVRWIVYCLFFIGLVQVLDSRKRIEIAIIVLLLAGCCDVFYGLVETFSGSEHVLWLAKKAHRGYVTGTYLNRNHFAGLMEICVILSACYAAAVYKKTYRKKLSSGRKQGLRSRLSRYLSEESVMNKRVLIIFAGTIIGTGLILSGSRGGILSAVGAMLCMSVLFIYRAGYSRRGGIILFLFMLAAVYVIQIGAEHTVDRFETIGDDFKDRRRLTQKTINMVKDYPFVGVGIGNFQYAYPKYQAVEDKIFIIQYAHNDWAQFLSEAGITGFCLLLICLGYYLYPLLKRWKRNPDHFAVCLGIAPVAAMLSIAVHSVSDFNLHIPANCLALLTIMAIGYSALYSGDGEGGKGLSLPYHAIPFKITGILVLAAVIFIMAWCGMWIVRHFISEYCLNAGYNKVHRENPAAQIKWMGAAVNIDRWNSDYWRSFASALMDSRSASAENTSLSDDNRINEQKKIITALEEAIRRNPLNGEYHMRLGLEYVNLWKEPDAHERWMPAADRAMERAAYFVGADNYSAHITIGRYWTMRSKMVYPGDSHWQSFWARACWHYKTYLSLARPHEREKISELIRNTVWTYYPHKSFVQQAIEK